MQYFLLCGNFKVKYNKKTPTKNRLFLQTFFGIKEFWSERRDLNPQQPPWEGGALPLNYFRKVYILYYVRDVMSIENKIRKLVFYTFLSKFLLITSPIGIFEFSVIIILSKSCSFIVAIFFIELSITSIS